MGFSARDRPKDPNRQHSAVPSNNIDDLALAKPEFIEGHSSLTFSCSIASLAARVCGAGVPVDLIEAWETAIIAEIGCTVK